MEFLIICLLTFLVELLKNTGELVNILMDLDDILCEHWSEGPLLTAMFEAIKEIG